MPDTTDFSLLYNNNLEVSKFKIWPYNREQAFRLDSDTLLIGAFLYYQKANGQIKVL